MLLQFHQSAALLCRKVLQLWAVLPLRVAGAVRPNVAPIQKEIVMWMREWLVWAGGEGTFETLRRTLA